MTAPVTDYITVDQLKTALQIKNDANDDLLQVAITAASRRIDEHCRDQFWSADTPSARVLSPDYPGDVWTGAYATTVGMTVETDEDNDGVFETLWDALDWQAEPLVPQAGYPFNRVVAVGNRFFPGSRKTGYLSFPYNGYGYGYAGYPGFGAGQTLFGQSPRARVRITAKWGWPAVPAQVMQACQILSIDYYKSKDFTNGSAGTTGLSTGVFGGQKGIQLHSGINPLACSLLRGLRDVVVA
jgi:hypothetical protein